MVISVDKSANPIVYVVILVNLRGKWSLGGVFNTEKAAHNYGNYMIDKGYLSHYYAFKQSVLE